MSGSQLLVMKKRGLLETEIITDIRRVARQLKRPPSFVEYKRHGRYDVRAMLEGSSLSWSQIIDAAGLREVLPAKRLANIKSIAAALLEEAKSLDYENGLLAARATFENLNLRSEVSFFDEVRRFEVHLLSRALELTGGNQRRAAGILGLSKTTLNYKVKAYNLL